MYHQNIRLAVRQADRWILAARQDLDPAIKVLHANYAVATIDLIRQLYSDQDVYEATGKEPKRLHEQATQLQDQASAQLRVMCPAIPR